MATTEVILTTNIPGLGRRRLITDADVQIDDPAGLAAALRQKRIRVHLLATGNGSGMGALQIIVGGTGGTIVSQFTPARWVEASRQLLRAASPQLLSRDAIDVNFIGDLAPIKLHADVTARFIFQVKSASEDAPPPDAATEPAGKARYSRKRPETK